MSKRPANGEPAPNDIGLVEVGYTLPGEPLDLTEWGSQMGVAPDRIRKLLDNGCRHFHAAGAETDADLVTLSVGKVLRRSGVDAADVAYLVHARTQNFSMPAPPHSLLSEVCARTGIMPKLALAAGQLACASIVAALELAVDLLRADLAARFALVTSSDRVFGGPEHRLRQNSGIQSDGGSAILVGRHHPRARIRQILVRSFPRLHAGPSSHEMGSLIGAVAWRHTETVLDELCAKVDLPLEATAGILPTNADMPYWRALLQRKGIDPALLYAENTHRRGHACCADLAVNLADHGLQQLAHGRPIVCFSQSNVGAYGCVVLEAAAA